MNYNHPFHIEKQTRIYDGEPYCGPSSNYIPLAFASIEEAKRKISLLNEINPVGWNIWNSNTRELVHGINFFDIINKE
jgi:hypothetical protein